MAAPKPPRDSEARITPGPHRQSVRALGLSLISALLPFAVVAAIPVARAALGTLEEDDVLTTPMLLVLGICALAGGAVAVVEWATKTWELTDAGLALRSGVLSRRQTEIPLARIHALTMATKPLEQLLGLVRVDVDTEGAAHEGELTSLGALDRRVTEALERELFSLRRAAGVSGEKDMQVAAADAPAETAVAAAPEATWRLTPAELALACVTKPRLGAAVLTCAALWLQAYRLLDDVGLSEGAFEWLAALAGSAQALDMVLLVIFVPAAIVLVMAFSFVYNLLSLGGFSVAREAGRLSVTRGLLSRSRRTVDEGRIQSVALRQGPLRRLVRRTEVVVTVVAGIGDDSGDASLGEVTLHPFLPDARVGEFLDAMLPGFAGAHQAAGLRACPPAAHRRALMRALIRAGVIVLCALASLWALGAATDWLAPLVGTQVADDLVDALQALALVAWLVAGALLCAGALLSCRHQRVGASGTNLVLVTGAWVRVTEVVPRRCLQEVTLMANPLQRRAGVCDLTSSTARLASLLVVQDLAREDAEALLAWAQPHVRLRPCHA